MVRASGSCRDFGRSGDRVDLLPVVGWSQELGKILILSFSIMELSQLRGVSEIRWLKHSRLDYGTPLLLHSQDVYFVLLPQSDPFFSQVCD